jgi:Domain of unknown function (DUF4129)
MRATGRGGIPRGWRRGPAGPVVRLAAAVLLLGLAALGSVARGVTRLSVVGMLAGPVRPVTVIAGVAAVAGCLVLAGVLILQASRERKESSRIPEPAPLWARVFTVFMVLALFASATAVVLVAFTGRYRGRHPKAAPISVMQALRHAAGPGHSSGTAGTAVLLLAVVVVLVVNVVAVVVLWRRRRKAAASRQAAEPSPLAAAVAAGSSALGTTAGVREAIIACYAAMEDTLAAAGSARRAADTPEELLDRAMRNGVIRTQAAQRLTALFREARFSPHELAEAQQQAATASLADISHDLSGAS